ncbi:MAG TPA: TonB family protein [Firmicutes bacterium]|nr:TonB family protein [Bacillota bacterium]
MTAGNDKTSIYSAAASMGMHLLFVIILTFAMMKPEPMRVALITDVTLIERKEYSGEPGLEKDVVGVQDVQQKIPDTVEKKEEQNAAVEIIEEPVEERPDVGELLRQLEEQKSKLDMGISRETLRREADSAETGVVEDMGEAVDAKNTVAGGDPVITGALSARRYQRIQWYFPEKLPEETELAVELVVAPSGIIRSVRLMRASGYPELDRLAVSQARNLKFDPLPLNARQEDQIGVLLFKFGARAQ